MVVNMGDSRAVLCTRGDRDELVPIQLTADLKPGVPSGCLFLSLHNTRVCAHAIRVRSDDSNTIFYVMI